MRRWIFITIFLASIHPSFSQDSIPAIDLQKLQLYGGISYGTGLFILSQAWYTDNGFDRFKFFNDNMEWLQVDKLGHVYGTYHFSNINYHLLKRTELSDHEANVWGSVLSSILFLPIEILDGFSKDYGFSYGDIIANTAGSGLFYFQQKGWGEQRIKLKYSFRTTQYPDLRPALLGENFLEQILKDYNGQSYWLSFDIHAFAKESQWPKWLNVAVGYGAEEMVFARNHQNASAGYSNFRQWFFGIDLDLSHIQTNNRFWQTVLFLADMIKLPAPALILNKGKLEGSLFYY